MHLNDWSQLEKLPFPLQDGQVLRKKSANPHLLAHAEIWLQCTPVHDGYGRSNCQRNNHHNHQNNASHDAKETEILPLACRRVLFMSWFFKSITTKPS